MPLGRAGREIEFPGDGDPVPGYRSAPAPGRGRGVVVVHEGAGLVDFAKDVCDRLAREGFVALAPDLYRGRRAADPAAARRLVESLDIACAAGDLDASVTALLNSDAVEGSRVGVVGFCMGGHLALLAGTRNRRIGAVVDFYGVDPGVSLDLSGLAAPVLGIFAEDDAYVPPAAVKRLQSDLEAAGTRAVFRVEPGVGHAFMNDSRPDVYDGIAAAAGWDAMLAFLRAELS
ncbi:MAG: dienelactone hydrolase family protein [Myxococcales bacterium]|nr:dienelactone hydrolase family protein [Myxococcales bacterium]